MSKTNIQWYPYEKFGCYFKLEDGILMVCAMHEDGTQDDNSCEVDWYEARDNDIDPLKIIQELETRE